MAEVRIDVPEELRNHADRWISAGRYVDLGDYIRDLIRRDAKDEERLMEALEHGLASGASKRSFDEIWASGVEKARSRAS